MPKSEQRDPIPDGMSLEDAWKAVSLRCWQYRGLHRTEEVLKETVDMMTRSGKLTLTDEGEPRYKGRFHTIETMQSIWLYVQLREDGFKHFGTEMEESSHQAAIQKAMSTDLAGFVV